jgi:hypothetical protein
VELTEGRKMDEKQAEGPISNSRKAKGMNVGKKKKTVSLLGLSRKLKDLLFIYSIFFIGGIFHLLVFTRKFQLIFSLKTSQTPKAFKARQRYLYTLTFSVYPSHIHNMSAYTKYMLKL